VTPADGSAHVDFSSGAAGSGPTTGYRVVATDVTEPSRGGQTVDGTNSPITVTGLTNGDTYTFTVTALSAAGNGPPSLAWAPVVIGVPTTPPQPPTIDRLAAGNGSVQVVFTPGAAGSTPTTGYRATATDATDPARGGQTAEGSASPITVTGLTNGDAYTFTVVAISAAGTSAPSVPSPRINAGVPAQISGSPPNGRIGPSYAFTFTVSGAPTPTLTLYGILPVGATFDATTGTISGWPETAGSYPIEVLAANGVGEQSVLRTLTIANSLGGVEPTLKPSPTTTPTPTPTPTPSTTPMPSTSPTSTTAPTGSGAPSTPPAAAAGASYLNDSSALARTGAASGWLLPLAGLLILGGAIAVLAARRRRAREGG
jgi:LPXTG-motif cell wall-anchored protein